MREGAMGDRARDFAMSDRRKELTRTARRVKGKLATDSFEIGESVTVRGAGPAVVLEAPRRIGGDYLVRLDSGEERRASWWVIDRIVSAVGT